MGMVDATCVSNVVGSAVFFFIEVGRRPATIYLCSVRFRCVMACFKEEGVVVDAQYLGGA